MALAAAGICAREIGGSRQADPFNEKPVFLAVDEAFIFSAQLTDGRLVGRWRMPEGYYLYRHGFRIQAGDGVELGPADIPTGKRIVDDYFGESEVYYGGVEVSAPILRFSDSVRAEFSYQGCADDGLCYPPQVRTVAFDAKGRVLDDEKLR